jgi:hypothetical protein
MAETHLKERHCDSLFLGVNSFSILRSDRSGSERGGFVFLIRNELNPVVLQSKSFGGRCEIMWVKIQTATESLDICGVYRSPASDNETNRQLNDNLSSMLSNRNSNVVLLGDFNFPTLHPDPQSCTCQIP